MNGSPRGVPGGSLPTSPSPLGMDNLNGPSPGNSTRWPSAPAATFCHQCGAPQRPSNIQVGRWHSGLCDMAGDLHNCVVTCFCPCVTFGQNVAALDREKTTSNRQAAAIYFGFMLVGLSCFCSGYWRNELRRKYKIPYAECGDYCLHLWCGPCALCQEHRELKYRGLIPGTNSQQEQAATTIPQPFPGMNRY